MMIASDAYKCVISLALANSVNYNRMTAQSGASLTDDSGGVIYNRNVKYYGAPLKTFWCKFTLSLL